MIGKKGISRCRFLKIPLAKAITQFKDLPAFREAEELAEELMARFLAGEVDRVVVVATRYVSTSVQKPEVFQLLQALDLTDSTAARSPLSSLARSSSSGEVNG